MHPPYRWIIFILIGVVLLAGLSVAAYNIPPVHQHLAWRVEDAISRVHNLISPPQREVFIPEGGQNADVATMVAATMQALTPSPTATCAPGECITPTAKCSNGSCETPTVENSPTTTPTSPPTLTPTAIPAQALLKGIVHEYQKMNNCGPTNLAMALSYWGWKGDQMTTAA